MTRILALVLYTVSLFPAGAQASLVQQVPGYCIPPDRPLLDEASLETLGMTRGEELTRYMNEAQSYSLCLDATKRQLYQEINAYIEQYRQALNE